MTGFPAGVDINIAAFEQVVEVAYTIPAIAVTLQHQGVPAAFAGMTVVFRQ